MSQLLIGGILGGDSRIVIDLPPSHKERNTTSQSRRSLCADRFGALQASTLWKKILRYDMDGAAPKFDRWVFAGGRKQAGLVRRRAAEREMFEG